MIKALQLRNGTTSEHAAFIGRPGEVTVDTDKHVPVIHDGVTVGGFPIMSSTRIEYGTNFNILTPTIVTPIDGSSSFTGTITSSPYALKPVFIGPHTGTDWEVSTDSLFANIISSSYHDTTNKTTFSVQGLTTSRVYIRVRYVSGVHLSSWSPTVQAIPRQQYINTPTITIEGAPTAVPLGPVLTASTFSIVGTNETHASSDWSVTDSTGTVVWNSLADTQNLTSIQLPNALLNASSTYTFQVVYHTATYTSDPGTGTAGTVAPHLVSPTIQVQGGPNSIPESPVLTGSAFSIVGSNETHTSSYWTATNASGTIVWSSNSTTNLTSIQIPPGSLTAGTAYTFQVVYRTANFSSPTSQGTTPGTTVSTFPSVQTPVLTVQGSPSSVPLSPLLTSTAFTSIANTETHVSTDWIVVDPSGTTVWSSLGNTTNLTQITVPAGNLTVGTSYTFSATYNAQTLTSAPGINQALTIPTVINTPAITVQGAPANVVSGPNLTSSAFSVLGATTTHASTDWVVTNVSGTVVWSAVGDTVNLKNITIPTGVLFAGSSYTFAVTYHSANLSSGTGTTTASTVATFPSITPPTLTVQGTPSSVPESPLLTASVYTTVGGAGAHVSTDWKVLNANGVVIWSSLANTTNLTTIQVPTGNLATGTTYTFSVTYNSSTLSSSTTTQGTTVVAFPGITTPTLTVQGAPSSVPENPTLTGSTYAVVGGAGAHVSTDWVVTDSVGTTVWSSPADTTNLVSVKIPKGVLTVGTTYVFTVKYNSAALSSLVGSTTGTTLSAFALVLAGVWLTKAPMPTLIYDHGQSTLLNGDVLVTGGTVNAVGVINTVYQYNLALNTWTQKTSLPALLKNHGQSTLQNGDVLVTGGFSGTVVVNTVYQYNLALNTWTQKTSMPAVLYIHGQSTLLNGTVLVTGGVTSVYVNTVYQYNLALDTWTQKTSLPVTLYSHAQSTLQNGDVLVTGGFTTVNVNTVYQYNVALDTWTQKTPMPVTKRYHGQSTLQNGDVLVTCGFTTVSVNTVYQYNVALDTWTQKTPMPFAAAVSGQSTLLDGTVLVTGGYTTAAVNTVYQYT